MLIEELIAKLKPFSGKGMRVILSSDSEGNEYNELSDVGDPQVWVRYGYELEMLYEDNDSDPATEITPEMLDETGGDAVFLAVGLWP